MKSKPDDRRDNVEKIQANITNTIRNMEAAEEIMAETDNPVQKKSLEAKNARREEALNSMRIEIQDEANDRQEGYK